MCIATSTILLGLGTAVSIAGAASQASGQIAQGNAQNELAQYRAQVAKNNAKLAEGDASYAIQAGRLQSYNQDMKNRSHLGTVKANQAASGVDINRGSAVDVRAGEAATGAIEKQNIESDANLKAYGYRRQANDYTAEAGLDERGGYNAQQASRTEAGSTVLGAASSLAFKWGSFAGGGGSGGAIGDSSTGPYYGGA